MWSPDLLRPHVVSAVSSLAGVIWGGQYVQEGHRLSAVEGLPLVHVQ